MITVDVKRIGTHDLPLPQYATTGAAGFDITCAALFPIMVAPGRTVKVPCGFAYSIPTGYYGEVLGRSGLALQGIHAHVGTIDADYTGEVAAIVINNSPESFVVTYGSRIAQMLIKKVEKVELMQVAELAETERGSNGFGSTGTTVIKKPVVGGYVRYI